MIEVFFLAAAMHPEYQKAAQAELDAVRALGDHPVAEILAEALRFYFEFHQADGFGWSAHVHDPLVAAHAVTGRFLQTAPMPVDVELAGTLTRGQAVADPLGRWGREPNVEVATTADAPAFIAHLMETLKAGLR